MALALPGGALTVSTRAAISDLTVAYNESMMVSPSDLGYDPVIEYCFQDPSVEVAMVAQNRGVKRCHDISIAGPSLTPQARRSHHSSRTTPFILHTGAIARSLLHRESNDKAS